MELSAVMGDIDQIFHQVLVQNKNRDVLRSLRRDNYIDSIEDYYMTFHLFGKVDPPCIANWAIKKTADNQSDSFDQISIKNIENDFYMDNFLPSFHEISVAIKVCLYVISMLRKGGFRLTKLISNNRSMLHALPTNNVSSKLTEISISANDIPIKPLNEPWKYYGTEKRNWN